MEAEIESLQSKQGRSQIFKSAAQRDAFLRESIQQLKITLEKEKIQLNSIQSSYETAKNDLQDIQKSVEETKLKSESRKTEIHEIDSELRTLREKREIQESERKYLLFNSRALWRDEAKLSSKLETIKDECSKTHRLLMGTMDRNTSKGLKAVASIAERFNINGYHGPLYELFKVDQKYQTAVEVVAGGSFFHVVVDTDDTAAQILKILNQEKAGRVTFMPLNRLKQREINYPDSTQYVKMISKLEYSQQYHPAMQQVFGKAIITPNLEVGSSFARQFNLTAVTFAGDRADKKGALTGGFLDVKHSRIETARSLISSQKMRVETELELAKVKASIYNIDQNVIRIRDEMSKLDVKRRHLVANRAPFRDDLLALSNQKGNLEAVVARLEKSINFMNENINAFEKQIHTNNQELGTKFTKKLTDAEQDRLELLSNQSTQLKNRLADSIKERAEIESRKSILEIEINANLLRRKEQLKEKIDGLADDSSSETINFKKKEMKVLDKKIKEANKRIDGTFNSLI